MSNLTPAQTLLAEKIAALMARGRSTLPDDLTPAEAEKLASTMVLMSGLHRELQELRVVLPTVGDYVLQEEAEAGKPRVVGRMYGRSDCATMAKIVVGRDAVWLASRPKARKSFRLFTADLLGLVKVEPTPEEVSNLAVADAERVAQHQKLYGTGRCPCCG